jgi:hypothetical protein
MAAPNDQFIEILPEASFKIGNGLKSPAIARSAFAILVSEEAMIIASRIEGNCSAGKQTVSRFLRPREDNDESTVGAVEAAAYAFQARIQEVMDDLVDKNMVWFENLSEFAKLRKFQAHSKPEEMAKIGVFISHLRNYVRGSILALLTADLPFRDSKDANSHRRAEQYLKSMDFDFESIWDSLKPRERIMTKFFWLLTRDLTLGSVYSNSLFDVCGSREDRNFAIPKAYGVTCADMTRLKSAKQEINTAILEAIKEDGYNDGEFPDECFPGDPSEMDESPAWKRQSTPSNQHDHTRSRYSAYAPDPSISMPEGLPFATQERLDYYKNRLPSVYPENAAVREGGVRHESGYYLPPILSKPSQVFGSASLRNSHNASKLPNMHDDTGRRLPSAPAGEDPFVDQPVHDQAGFESRTGYTVHTTGDVSDEPLHSSFFRQLPDRSRPSSRLSDERPLLQKEPNRPRVLGKKPVPDSLTLDTSDKAEGYRYPFDEDLSESPLLNALDKLEKENYESGTFNEDISAFNAYLLRNLNSQSGKVVVSPMSIQGSSKDSPTPQKDFVASTMGVLSGNIVSPQSNKPTNINEKLLESRNNPTTTGYSPVIEAHHPLPETLRRNLRDSDKDYGYGSPYANATISASPTTSPAKRMSDATPRKPVVPKDFSIKPGSPFFSVDNFLVQVSNYLRSLSATMLSTGESDFYELTDTLLCLTDAEYKFLPLWAGGNDDGTGGVNDTDMPPAMYGGPSGPGPSYHTGSTVNSRASTEVDWDGRSEVDTSVLVENGYSDHIDRRIVLSDDGFGDGSSIAFSDDTEDYGAGDVKGKGKAVDVDAGVEMATPKMKPASVSFAIDLDDDEEFMNLSDEELDLDE